VVGVFLLRSAVQGWFMGGRSARFIRLGVVVAALFVIEGGEIADVVGVGLAGRCSLYREWSGPIRTPRSRSAARRTDLLDGGVGETPCREDREIPLRESAASLRS